MEPDIQCIAAAVVLYNPDPEAVIKNISSYKDSVHRVILVDNSPGPLAAGLKRFIGAADNLVYVSMIGNKGIAAALNRAAALAIETHHSWLLTMDQDSEAPAHMVAKIWQFINTMGIERLGIVAATPSTVAASKHKSLSPWQFSETVYTSGNLVNLAAYRETGGWEEKLFIDRVDMIFCLEVQLKNWKIVTLNDVVFRHTIGKEKITRLLGMALRRSTSHDYIRTYYMHRNRLYLLSNRRYRTNFPSTIRMEINSLLREPIKILLFEDDKLRKFQSIALAQLDFRRKQFGKYEDNRRA